MNIATPLAAGLIVAGHVLLTVLSWVAGRVFGDLRSRLTGGLIAGAVVLTLMILGVAGGLAWLWYLMNERYHLLGYILHRPVNCGAWFCFLMFLGAWGAALTAFYRGERRKSLSTR